MPGPARLVTPAIVDLNDVPDVPNAAVAAKFAAYPAVPRQHLLAMRAHIFRVAQHAANIGALHESLKWGEPAYRPVNGAGSTIRIDWKARTPDEYAMYFHCQTNLIASFRDAFPGVFRFAGNRAIVFRLHAPVPAEELGACIAAAFTYHRRMA